ncbi:MAG: hypothetical protein HC826_00255 [Rhodospirillales bacterium]|nr:hypothetical protein [Rhodospirillales bacterium]
MLYLLAFLSLITPAVKPAMATAIGQAPDNLVFDGDPAEWRETAAVMTLLPTSPKARGGHVWVAQAADGLIVAGRVTGPSPTFPTTADAIWSGDHLELSLALIDEVPLPLIGWGNQFGPVELETAESCAAVEDLADSPNSVSECQTWYNEQQSYRRQLRKLFVRRWQLAPGITIETLAAPAFASLPDEAKAAALTLAPSETASNAPTTRFATTAEGGYSFEIAIPWSALPPSPTLDLSEIRMMVDVLSPGTDREREGPLATTSGERKGEDVETFNLLRLAAVKQWDVTRCRYPLNGEDQWTEQKLPAYFFPANSSEISELFVLENDAAGYQYAPAGYSPAVEMIRFFSETIAPDLTLCGPPVALRRGNDSSFSRDLSLSRVSSIKRVEGGWLIADGPYLGSASRFGSGACGACPLIGLQVLYLPETKGQPSVAFADAWLIEDEDITEGLGRNARVQVSDDLTTITAWEGETPADARKMIWTRIRQCYDPSTHLFEECGQEEGVTPPIQVPLPPDPSSP